jgi:hypothetical protein
MKIDKEFIIALIVVFIFVLIGFTLMLIGLSIFGYTTKVDRYRAAGVGIDENEEVVSKVKPQSLIYNKNFM